MMRRVISLLALFTGLLFAQEYLPAPDSTVQVIHHYAYTVGYSPKHRQAKWVYYKLTRDQVLNKAVKRSNKFRPDPMVPDGPTPEEYKHSGYDRGHIAPAADFKCLYRRRKNLFT